MGVLPRVLRSALALVFSVSALACATGGGSSTIGTRRDSGVRNGSVGDGSRDSGSRDSGSRDSDPGDGGSRDTGVRDTGTVDTGPACVDDAIPDDCDMAQELGSLDPGGSFSVDGKLPTLADEDWYAFDVPPGFSGDAGTPMAGAGMPTVELVAPDATMVMEVRMRCGAALACGDSTARELLSWSFVDDQSMEGDGAYSTRDVPWPERVYVKVSRRGGTANCEGYMLNVSR